MPATLGNNLHAKTTGGVTYQTCRKRLFKFQINQLSPSSPEKLLMLSPIFFFLFHLVFVFQMTEIFEDVHSLQQRGDSGLRCVIAGAAERGVTPVALIREWGGCC